MRCLCLTVNGLVKSIYLLRELQEGTFAFLILRHYNEDVFYLHLQFLIHSMDFLQILEVLIRVVSVEEVYHLFTA